MRWLPLIPGTPDGSDTVSTTEATATSPMPSEGPVFVRTDSSGKAQVYFQLGDAKGQQRVTITVNGADYENTFFRATAANVVSADAATITIVDGDSQRADADEPLDEPLVVIVKDSGGRIVAGAPVTFTTNSGSLAAPELGDPGVYPPVDSDGEVFGEHTNRFIVVQTDDTGKASVGYNVGDLPGAKQVFATIDVANGRTREKTFSVNGRAISSRDPADDDDDDEDDEDDTHHPRRSLFHRLSLELRVARQRLRLPHLRLRLSQLADSVIPSYRRMSGVSHGQVPLSQAGSRYLTKSPTLASASLSIILGIQLPSA